MQNNLSQICVSWSKINKIPQGELEEYPTSIAEVWNVPCFFGKHSGWHANETYNRRIHQKVEAKNESRARKSGQSLFMQGHSKSKRFFLFRLQYFFTNGKKSMWLLIGHLAPVIGHGIVGRHLRLRKAQTLPFWDRCVVLPASSILTIQNVRSKWTARLKIWRANLPNHSAAYPQLGARKKVHRNINLQANAYEDI